ncbi:hypothetical protein [Actinomadura sp. 3N508]|uniref:hypothetical protein n=1 Tax=Actinomadura sp. 3N508 TaxID=3375153 RepID=UPI003796EB6D
MEGAVAVSPRVGSDLWRGQAEAAEVVRAAVEHAETDGQLRGIMDAVRAHRVQDDFSEHWSFAREDFERKLYSKRSKVTVRFVELTDTIPVQGPETEVLDGLVYGDFLALLDPRERQVVVLLRSGVTNLTEIAQLLGYAKHSPVSKAPGPHPEEGERLLPSDVGATGRGEGDLPACGRFGVVRARPLCLPTSNFPKGSLHSATGTASPL